MALGNWGHYFDLIFQASLPYTGFMLHLNELTSLPILPWRLQSEQGIYLVQSERIPHYYRIGAGGIQGGTLRKRLELHSKPADVGNWTLFNRPWIPLWVLEVTAKAGTATSDAIQATKGLEAMAVVILSKQCQVLNTSGFYSDKPAEEIMAMLSSELNRFQQMADIYSS